MALKKVLTRKEDIEQNARDFHDHNLTDLPTLKRTLCATIAAIEKARIPYALIGGVAVKEMGRPRITHDIDIFVPPDFAEQTLQILKNEHFQTERRDPHWLYKAWKEEILVDVIFKSSGDIYFDEEVRSHVRRISYDDMMINAISPEDFIVIKAAAHQEHIPHHWHDALAVLMRGDLDWEYLLRRARYAPRRVLALLIYGQSNDIAIPNEVIQKLYHKLFEAPLYTPPPIFYPYREGNFKDEMSTFSNEKEPRVYIKGKIMEALTMDGRIAEHDIKIHVSDNTVLVRGEVFNNEQKDIVDEIVHNISPDYDIKNHIYVRILSAPEGSEVIE